MKSVLSVAAPTVLARLRVLLAASPLAWWLIAPLRHLIESSMSLHMLLQFPLLFAAGWAMAAWLPAGFGRWQAQMDVHGLASATLATCVSALWMIPSALDLSVIEPVAAFGKYASWIAAGALMAGGWARLGPELAAFFLGNTAWMLLTAGLLYREAQARLCVSYRFDEQLVSGTGLVAWGMAVGMVALWRLAVVMRVVAPVAGEGQHADNGGRGR